MKHVVSFSGGKDSTALLLMMMEKNMQIDDIIFCDTGMEFPAMYTHVDKVEAYIGQKITRLKGKKTFEYFMFDRVKTKGPHAGKTGYGWPTSNKRWCTGQLKVRLIETYLKQLDKTNEILQYIGIAADEAWRKKEKQYPLIDWQITEAHALQYCYDKGFDWDGLYKIFRRCSCWCCPLQRIGELKKLRTHYPKLWQHLIDMDERSINQFKENYSVQQLEKRFSMEDEYKRMQIQLDFGLCL